MPGSTLYVLCGLPFSGKTTLACALVDQCRFVHLDLDAMARAKGLFPEEGVNEEQWGQIYTEACECMAVSLLSGRSVVFDAVNFDRHGRDHLRAFARQAGSPAFVIYFDIPIEEIIQRRQENRKTNQRPRVLDTDFEQILKEFEAPTGDESLLFYDGVQSLPEWITNNIPGKE